MSDMLEQLQAEHARTQDALITCETLEGASKYGRFISAAGALVITGIGRQGDNDPLSYICAGLFAGVAVVSHVFYRHLRDITPSLRENTEAFEDMIEELLECPEETPDNNPDDPGRPHLRLVK